MRKNIFLKSVYRPTWAEIDLSAIEHNFRRIRSNVGKGTKIMVVLKADAYGHGAVPIAKRLAECGADYFGLASVEEAKLLREDRIGTPILLLGALCASAFSALLKYKITPTITDLNIASRLDKYMKKSGRKIPVHLKVDTGMGRMGVWHWEFLKFAKDVNRLGRLIIEGVYTHLASAESDKKFTNYQLSLFERIVGQLESIGTYPLYRHAANSAAVIGFGDSHFNLVRPGLMIYGLSPGEKSTDDLCLKPAMSFKTRIVCLKDVPQGCSISYGRAFIARRRMKAAVLPVGYADGYNRQLSDKGSVLIRGRHCRVVGRVCMDYTVVDVSPVNAKVGDEAVLFGRQNSASICVEEIASLCSTIPYEVTCWVSHRVPRFYLR